MVAVAKWTEAQKAEAIAIAEASSIPEASKATGVPTGTIKYWRTQEPTDQPTPEEKRRAIKEALTRAMAHIEQRQADLADKSFSVAAFALEVVEDLVQRAAAQQHKVDYPALIRAVVGVYAQTVEKGQLVSGQATARSEERHEHRHVDYQEARERVLSRVDRLATNGAAVGRDSGGDGDE